MLMEVRPTFVAGILLLSSLTAACESNEPGHFSCSLTASIAFEGRDYIAAEHLPDHDRDETRVGKRLGIGQAATCPGQPERDVKVFRLVGIPVAEAVLAMPVFGVMERWNRDGAIE